MEKIVPKVSFGEVQQTDTDVRFVRKSDGQKTSFPLEAKAYLQSFVSGFCIQDIILQNYQNGISVDFAILKQTLLTLYWSGNLENKNAFRNFIELYEWIPVSESRLLRPILEVEQDGMIIQFLIFALSVGLVAFTGRLLMEPGASLVTLLFFPQAFMMTKGLFSDFIAGFFRKKALSSNIHVSFLGIYLREPSTRHSAISAFEYALHFILLMVMSLSCLYFFKNSENHDFKVFGSVLTLLLTCLMLSPSHKTEISKLYITLEKLDSGLMKLWSTTLILNSLVVFLGLTFCFYLIAAIESVAMVTEFGSLLFLPRVLLFIFSVSYFLDLLDDFDFMLDQMKTQFALPLKNLLTVSKSTKDAKNILSSIPIFQSIPVQILDEITRATQVQRVRAGVTLFREGERSTDLYVIIKGSVGIYKKNVQLMKMGVGSVFGEGGFFLNRARGGDAICLSGCTLLRIKRPENLEEGYKIPVASASIFQMKIWAFQALTNSALFKQVPAELAMQIISRGKICEVAAGNTILRKGDLPDSLWIIIEGECRANMDGGARRDLHSGDVFGEIGVLWNTRRTSTVGVTRPSILLRVDSSDIWPLLSSNLNLCVALQSLANDRLTSEAA